MDKWKIIPNIATHDGRRALAFLATIGAGMFFSLIILWSLYELRGNPGFIFWLALAAHVQVFMVLGALGWVMGRRMQANVSKDGAGFDDRSPPQ